MTIFNLIITLFWLLVVIIWLVLMVGNYKRWRGRQIVDPVEGLFFLLNFFQLVLVVVLGVWYVVEEGLIVWWGDGKGR
jgi:hypothetical protein